MWPCHGPCSCLRAGETIVYVLRDAARIGEAAPTEGLAYSAGYRNPAKNRGPLGDRVHSCTQPGADAPLLSRGRGPEDTTFCVFVRGQDPASGRIDLCPDFRKTRSVEPALRWVERMPGRPSGAAPQMLLLSPSVRAASGRGREGRNPQARSTTVSSRDLVFTQWRVENARNIAPFFF